jgi:hypothetical protein
MSMVAPARSGRFTTLTEVVTTLDREGYSANQIQGPLLKRQLTGLIKAARPEPARQRPLARRPGQLSNGRPVSWEGLRVAKRSSLTAMSPRTHGPLQRRGSIYARRLAGLVAQGPRGRRSQVLWPTEWNLAPAPLLASAHLPPCRSALQAPRPSPSARGLLRRRSAGAGTVPATLSGVAEGSGAGCNSELGFCAMSGKSGGRVGGLTGGGSGGQSDSSSGQW